MKSTRHPDASEVTLDIITSCECCCYGDVALDQFLEGFVDHLPEKGGTAGLRVRFTGGWEGQKGINLPSGDVLRQLEHQGFVARGEDAIVATGLLVRACGNAH